jgi:PhoH-like ATPase
MPLPPPPAKRAKLFVLDTNVLLHDPMCLFRFEEHDIFLPMIVLEELDGHKKGMTEVARNARQASRTLDALAGAQGADIATGLKLDTTGHREAGGCLFFQTQPLDYTLPMSLPQGKADNQILGVVEALRNSTPREVVLVSKDINMRVKARALGLATEDYQNDKTLEDGDLLYAGSLALPPDFWSKHGKTWKAGNRAPHLLPHHRPDRAQPADQPVCVFRGARRAQPVCPRDRNPRQDRGAQDAQGLQSPEERRVGRDHAQPRAELRDEPADGPGG